MLTTSVVLWAGWPFFQRGWRSMIGRNLVFAFLCNALGIPLAGGVLYPFSLDQPPRRSDSTSLN